MALGVSLGSATPGGTGISIAAGSVGAAAVGDLVIIGFCWGVGNVALSTVSDTAGNTWNVVSTPAVSNESGGYGWTIVTTGWAASGNTITGTLASGAPGGRCWVAAKITAANLVASPFDQHNEGTGESTSTPSLATAASLAQAAEAVFLVAIVREAASTVPTWTSPTPSGAVVVISATGSGTVNSGIAILEFDNSVGTAAVTIGFTAQTATGHHGLGIIAFKLSSGITVSAPVATFDAVGATTGAAELAQAPAATFTAVGLVGQAELVAQAPATSFSAVGQLPVIPGPPVTLGDRGPWYRPVIETIEEWAEWIRQS